MFTNRLLCLGCDACGLLIAMYSDRCFSVWSDSGELEGRSSANPDRDLDLLGEPSVTNIDVLIPGHGPGTLLLVFRTSVSFEKECEKIELRSLRIYSELFFVYTSLSMW